MITLPIKTATPLVTVQCRTIAMEGYCRSRDKLVERLVGLNTNVMWEGYATALADLRKDIAVVDEAIVKLLSSP